MKQTQLYILLLLLLVAGCQWNLDKVVWNCDLENCVNGVCNESTDECECEDGYWGINCDKEVVTFEKTLGEGIGRSVRQTADNKFIITGHTHNSGNELNDMYIIKVDMNGDELWDKTFGGDYNYDIGNSVEETLDGRFIVTGSTSSYGNGGNDVYLIKIDTNGNELWSKTFGGIGYDIGAFVAETLDGGFIITGSSSYGNGGIDAYLIRTNMNGTELWSKTFGGSEDDYGYSVEETSDGGFIITGYTESYGNGSADVYLIKTDANGNL